MIQYYIRDTLCNKPCPFMYSGIGSPLHYWIHLHINPSGIYVLKLLFVELI